MKKLNNIIKWFLDSGGVSLIGIQFSPPEA